MKIRLSKRKLCINFVGQILVLLVTMIFYVTNSFAAQNTQIAAISTYAGKIVLEMKTEKKGSYDEKVAKVRIGDRILYEATIGQFSSASLEKLARLKNEEVFLFSYGTGGNLCTDENYLIIVKKDKDVFITSDSIICGGSSSPKIKNDGVKIAFPQGTFKPPIVFEFKNGNLSKDGENIPLEKKVLKPNVNLNLSAYVNKSPYDLLAKNKKVQQEFRQLLKNDFIEYTDHLVLSGENGSGVVKRDYFIASGCKAHACDTDQAVLVIDIITGKPYAAMSLNAEEIIIYGAKEKSDMPEELLFWILKTKSTYRINKVSYRQ